MLKPGDKKRITHNCGEGRNLIISLDDRGYHAWCFRCSDGGHEAPPTETLGEKLARLSRMQSANEQATASADLPAPRVYDVSAWPSACAVWLYRAGLSRADIGKLGAYYHPPTDRVVLPIVQQGRVTFWQARTLTKGNPCKYIAAPQGKAGVLPRYGKADAVTLTEDILSAYKVGLVGEGWSLLGTTLTDTHLSELMKRGAPVNVWLDPDAAGRKAAQRIIKRLLACGLAARNVVSNKDPKLMQRSEIKELLSAHQD